MICHLLSWKRTGYTVATAQSLKQVLGELFPKTNNILDVQIRCSNLLVNAHLYKISRVKTQWGFSSSCKKLHIKGSYSAMEFQRLAVNHNYILHSISMLNTDAEKETSFIKRKHLENRQLHIQKFKTQKSMYWTWYKMTLEAYWFENAWDQKEGIFDPFQSNGSLSQGLPSAMSQLYCFTVFAQQQNPLLLRNIFILCSCLFKYSWNASDMNPK